MNVHDIDTDDFYMEAVPKKSASIFASITCGKAEIDRYFHEDAQYDTNNVCYAYLNRKNGDVIGLATLSCSGININSHNLIELIPAMKIDYFAVSEQYQDIELTGESDPKEHYYVSDAFLSELIKAAREISESYIGATHIILYSVEDAVHFYERNLFAGFEEYMKPEQYRYLEGCKPMYMPL